MLKKKNKNKVKMNNNRIINKRKIYLKIFKNNKIIKNKFNNRSNKCNKNKMNNNFNKTNNKIN